MPRHLAAPTFLAAFLALAGLSSLTPAQKKRPAERPPHGQDRMPGPALSPADAIKKMKVPEGFSVELVAAEPDLVNPVAMTFDEKGRVWVTESLEYPRRSRGPGKDRVKVLEDTDGDGKADKFTVFAEGLNIPSGIAVGHGGVWVANAPDVLFYKVGKDGKAAGKPEVVVTGFGRDDTHELPNSLTWGPDGWLYGWNGVFNPSHVKQNGKEWRFTCAIFRIHPKTREFQLFCEGTSNPWGLAINPEGHFFASACVIDHLWHLTETGYYLRQGGPYPPYTWILGSIVKHKHQKAAYCGLHYFDSDAYPKEYRDRLYMGNIHGGCINVDVLKRDGSTYLATAAPDLLTANDQWFMPVAQKTGPDGCLYVLDWYDRYHCYQDANRDPKGIDRLRGRLYRVRYKGTPRAKPFDLSRESDDELINRLQSANVYYRDIAQRLLTERSSPALRAKLQKVVLDEKAGRKGRMHALWALVGGGALGEGFHLSLLAHEDAGYRAWGVRAAGNQGEVRDKVRDKVVSLAKDASPDVLVQVAVASRKLRGVDALPVLVEVLARAGDDRLIPGIVWQNLQPLLEDRAGRFVEVVRRRGATPNLGAILPRVVERMTASRKAPPGAMADLYELVREGKNADAGAARKVLTALAAKAQTGELTGEGLAALKKRLARPLAKELAEGKGAFRLEAAVLLTAFKDEAGLKETRRLMKAAGEDEARRLAALNALAAVKDAEVLSSAGALLGEAKRSDRFRGEVLAALGKLDDDKVAAVVLGQYARLGLEVQPRAVELLTQRSSWGKALLKAVADKKVSAGVLNVNQARRLLASKDAELVALMKKHYGVIRTERNAEREKVVARMRQLLGRTKGDPHRGIKVYSKLCAQCHKLHGEGAEVGPDITGVGRATFELLVSNVFDPSLVIGPGYHGVTVETKQGRQLTGLLVEDGKQRVVLKVQGGKQEAVARKDVEKVEVSKLSLMPEDVEKQLKPREIADLFAFLCLDKHPDEKSARWIPGTPKGLRGGR